MPTCVICATPLTGRQTVVCTATTCRYRRMYDQQKANGLRRRLAERPESRAKQRLRNARRLDERRCLAWGDAFRPHVNHPDQTCCDKVCSGWYRAGGMCHLPASHPARWFGEAIQVPADHAAPAYPRDTWTGREFDLIVPSSLTMWCPSHAAAATESRTCCQRADDATRTSADLLLAEWADDRVRRSLPPVTTTWLADDVRFFHLLDLVTASAA